MSELNRDRMAIDSDENIDITGTVLSLERGRPDKHNMDRLFLGNTVTLTIESDKNRYKVDLPIKTQTNFDLIPYLDSLLNVEVKYSAMHRKEEIGYTIRHTYWKLEILSGKLKGISLDYDTSKRFEF